MAVAAWMLSGVILGTFAPDEGVNLVSATPSRLVEKDGQPRVVEVLAAANRGERLEFRVLHWPEGASPRSRPDVWVDAFLAAEGGPTDLDKAPGNLRVKMPREFKDTGLYRITAQGALDRWGSSMSRGRSCRASSDSRLTSPGGCARHPGTALAAPGRTRRASRSGPSHSRSRVAGPTPASSSDASPTP